MRQSRGRFEDCRVQRLQEGIEEVGNSGPPRYFARKYAVIKQDLRGTVVATRSKGMRRALRGRDARKVRGRGLNAQYRQSARARRELVLEGTRKFSHKSLKLTTAQCNFAHAHGEHMNTSVDAHYCSPTHMMMVMVIERKNAHTHMHTNSRVHLSHLK